MVVGSIVDLGRPRLESRFRLVTDGTEFFVIPADRLSEFDGWAGQHGPLEPPVWARRIGPDCDKLTFLDPVTT